MKLVCFLLLVVVFVGNCAGTEECIQKNWRVFYYPIGSDLLLDGLLNFSSTEFSLCLYKKTHTDVYCSIEASGTIEYTNNSMTWDVNRCKTSNDDCECYDKKVVYDYSCITEDLNYIGTGPNDYSFPIQEAVGVKCSAIRSVSMFSSSPPPASPHYSHAKLGFGIGIVAVSVALLVMGVVLYFKFFRKQSSYITINP